MQRFRELNSVDKDKYIIYARSEVWTSDNTKTKVYKFSTIVF